MILCDATVLVHAHKRGAPEHDRHHTWLAGALHADEPFGVSDLVLSEFLRLVTHPRLFDPPSTWSDARDFARTLRTADNAVPVSPGRRHWAIFQRLVEDCGEDGHPTHAALPDAYLAALAIEAGAEWITTDRGFARYPGLRWRHPLTTRS